MHFGKTTPILRIFDEAKAKEFYVGFLGFAVDWEHRFAEGMPLYMAVSRGDCLLHLSEHYGDCCPGAAVRIAIDDVDAYCLELLAKQYKYYCPGVEQTPWGSRDMDIRDPFGNRLTFTTAISN
ncbi:MAG: glyoxalase superfamily protein [Pirellulales bacterium]